MAKAMQKLIFALLVCQWVYAAPSDIKLEDIAEVTQAEERSDVKPNTLLDENTNDEASQGNRQKRWYNYFPGFPPFNPNGFGRDDLSPSVLGAQDPLIHIHRRLQEINNVVRQPPLPQFPPQLPQFPAFIPVIYIPQVGCACTPDNTPTDRPAPPQGNQNTTENPDVSNRWPEMEDERQNWGIVMNGTGPEMPVEDDGDGSRPISFDPIKPIQPMDRPAPPVDHGTSEGGQPVNNGGTTTTTTSRPVTQAPNFPASSPGLTPPSACDGAVLSCCHQPQVTYDCFAIQGCPDPSAYGNPCDSGVIFRVIERFQRFYGQRNG